MARIGTASSTISLCFLELMEDKSTSPVFNQSTIKDEAHRALSCIYIMSEKLLVFFDN